MKRPAGIIIISLLLGWLAIAGFMNVIFSDHGPILLADAMLYGIFAAISAIGLWFLKPWAYPAVIAWSTTCIHSAINMQIMIVRISWPFFIVFQIIMLAILLLLIFYVYKKLVFSKKRAID